MTNAQSLHRHAAALVLPWLAIACTSDPTLPVPPSLVTTSVDDGAARVSPTAEIALTFSTAIDGDSVDQTAIAVVEGIADEALAHTLAHQGATPALLPRLVPGALFVDGTTARFQPLRPLAPDSLHTLVVTATLRAGGLHLTRPALRPFSTGPADSGAPTWSLLDPLAGATEIVRNVYAIEVAFSRPVVGVDGDSLLLVGSRGAVQTTLEAGDCPNCFRILPRAPLDGGDAFRILAFAPIADAWGEPPFPLAVPPAFVTSSAIRKHPPAIATLVADASSGCLVTRFVTDVAASGTLCIAGRCVADPSRVLVHELCAALAAGALSEWSIAARDESTAPAGSVGPLPAPPSSPRTLTITEVLGRPLGPRLAQQFVELWNRGAAPVATDGLELHDEQGGNQIPAAQIPPGGYALVVPADFSADDGVDARPRENTLLLRVDERHLGGRGFHVGGAAIALVEADGRPVSRFSTYDVAVTAGQSVMRIGACDIASSYGATPNDTATPGGP